MVSPASLQAFTWVSGLHISLNLWNLSELIICCSCSEIVISFSFSACALKIYYFRYFTSPLLQFQKFIKFLCTSFDGSKLLVFYFFGSFKPFNHYQNKQQNYQTDCKCNKVSWETGFDNFEMHFLTKGYERILVGCLGRLM